MSFAGIKSVMVRIEVIQATVQMPDMVHRGSAPGSGGLQSLRRVQAREVRCIVSIAWGGSLS